MKKFEIKNRESFHVSLGERGEMVSWSHLREQGYQLIEKNYRCKIGEIDVVAKRDGYLTFIEVKTRRHHRFGRPEEAVDRKKQEKLIKLSQYYMKEKSIEEQSVAFDVLSITWQDQDDPEFLLIKDAFSLESEQV